jgi:hypothetical protein
MSQMGHSRHFDSGPATSALPRITDISGPARLARYVSQPDSCTAGLTPVTCLGENSNRLPTKATKELRHILWPDLIYDRHRVDFEPANVAMLPQRAGSHPGKTNR